MQVLAKMTIATICSSAVLLTSAAQCSRSDKSCFPRPERGDSLFATGSRVLPPMGEVATRGILEDNIDQELLAEEGVGQQAARSLTASKHRAPEPSPALLKQIGADLDDAALLEEEGARPQANSAREQKQGDDAYEAVKTPAFYTSLCLDALISAVVLHGFFTWRKQRQSRLAEVEEAAPAEAGSGSCTVDTAALEEAVRADDVARCKALLRSAGASKFRVLRNQDLWGCTPLHVAAHHGCAAVAEALLDEGADIDATDAWDQTPLHFAARAGSVEVCSVLLDKGAAMDAKDAQDWTALLEGARANQEATCRLLLRRGATTGGVAEEELPPMLSSLLVQMIFDRPPRVTSMEEDDVNDDNDADDDDRHRAEGDSHESDSDEQELWDTVMHNANGY